MEYLLTHFYWAEGHSVRDKALACQADCPGSNLDTTEEFVTTLLSSWIPPLLELTQWLGVTLETVDMLWER